MGCAFFVTIFKTDRKDLNMLKGMTGKERLLYWCYRYGVVRRWIDDNRHLSPRSKEMRRAVHASNWFKERIVLVGSLDVTRGASHQLVMRGDALELFNRGYAHYWGMMIKGHQLYSRVKSYFGEPERRIQERMF